MLDLDILFERQLSVWPMCRQHYEELSSSCARSVFINGRDYHLTFNPHRLRSAAAKVDGGEVQRPCFLCASARPAEQVSVEMSTPFGHVYDVALNPYPITDRHFTIIAHEHVRQDLAGRQWDMAWFADQMPDFLIFFNGAQSGASAPDHMHFQAVPKAAVPLLAWSEEQRRALGVTRSVPTVGDSDWRNVICWTEGDDCWWLVIERKAHRPSQYYAAGAEQLLVSPAALEFCGLVPLARREDYDRLTPSLLHDVLCQCERREPVVRVGVVEGQQIRLSADERVHSLNYLGEGRILDVIDYGSNRAEKREITEFWSYASPFTLDDVTIGKDFHWQQRERQTFCGALHVIACQGALHAINIVPVEEYLKSVISSEMSADNNLELLKAHAVISRSWVLRQLPAEALPWSMPVLPESDTSGEVQPTGGGASGYPAQDYRTEAGAAPSSGQGEEVAGEQVIVRYWDHDDHALFDVCADDHCQRYQGITRAVSPRVAEAVEATRGEVLTDQDGNLCDARFSKCCGGRTERFATCWQGRDYHYLQPVDDPWCDPAMAGESDEERQQAIRAVLNDYDRPTMDYHDWSVTYSQQELSELVEQKLHLGLGEVQRLVPVERGASGHICLLRIEGSLRTVLLGKELMIRKALSPTHLLSSWFDVERSVDDQGTVHFRLTGRGWGHGVGLCQIGAANMSRHGKTADEILHHYFTGAVVKRIY